MIVNRCTCHSIIENSQGQTATLHILGVNCGFCEEQMAEAEQQYADEINEQFPHGAGLAEDDHRRDYLRDAGIFPSRYEWENLVRDWLWAENARCRCRACETGSGECAWGGESPF